MTILRSKAARLRLIGYLEGSTLLLLVFVAVPLKHVFGNASLTSFLGPLHGALFLLFVLNTLAVSIEQRWAFRRTTWKVLLSCLVPFGTFYIDYKILKNIR